MHTEMTVSEARENLPETIENLSTSGPITITRYGKPVATLSAYVSAEEREELAKKELKSYLALFFKVGDNNAWNDFERVGLDTAARIGEFLAELAKLDREINFEWDLDDVPAGLTIPQMVATVHLYKETSEALTAAGQDIVAWSDVLLEIKRAARDKGDQTNMDSSGDDDAPSIAEKALAVGLTPETFKERAYMLIAQGVTMRNMPEALGDNAIPADILAMSPNASRYVGELANTYKLPMAEVCALVRDPAFADPSSSERTLSKAADAGRRFAAAGVKDAKTIVRFYREDLDSGLAQRAHTDGLSVEEWAIAVKTVEQYAYGNKGALPFRLLSKAALDKVNLTAWDDNKTAAKLAKARNKHFYGDPLKFAPWAELYAEPELILELAKAKISPAFVAELHILLAIAETKRWDDMSAREHVDTYKKVRQAGITAQILKQMNRVPRGRGYFKPKLEQLLQLAELGLTEAEAKFLRDRGDEPQSWLWQMEKWQSTKFQVSQWILGQKQRDQWQSIEHLAALVDRLRKGSPWSRDRWVRNRMTPLALEAFTLDPMDLHYGHVADIMELADWSLSLREDVIDFKMYFEAIDSDAVRRMLYEFQSFMRELFPRKTAESDGVTVEQVREYVAETKEISQ